MATTNEDYMKDMIGKKLLIVGKHPHKDSVGTVVGFDYTNAGPGMRVKLDNGLECFVFKPENVRWL
jgi:ATP-dependent Lon protease